MIDAFNTTRETQTVSGFNQTRERYSVGIHNQLIKPSKGKVLALVVCIDDGAKGQLVSCQRYGVVNLLLRKEVKNIQYGDALLARAINPHWTSTLTDQQLDNKIGEVVAVYHNNPQRGYTTVRVRLTL